MQIGKAKCKSLLMLGKPSRVFVQKTLVLLQQWRKHRQRKTEWRLKTLTSNLSVRMSRIFWELGSILLTCCVLAPLLFHASVLLSQLLSRRDPEIYKGHLCLESSCSNGKEKEKKKEKSLTTSTVLKTWQKWWPLFKSLVI